MSQNPGRSDQTNTEIPPAVDDQEQVTPPANISGSYLVCEQARNAEPEVYEATTLCALQDELTRQKVDLATQFASYAWKPDVPALPSVSSRSRELLGDPRWHLELITKADSALLLDEAIEGTTLTLTVRDRDGLAKQASANFKAGSIDCSGLIGGVWVPVPGDSIYGTKDFCVQKYAPANLTGVAVSQADTAPWVNISQTSAITTCSALGAGFHLITNPEWMTLAANLANVGINWSSGQVGSGTLRRGHSDNNPGNPCAANASDANAYVEGDCSGLSSGSFTQRRTSYLSNGSVIWDIGGNVWNWISYNNSADKPTPAADDWTEYTAVKGSTTTPLAHLTPLNSSQSFWDNSWNSAQGIGQIYHGTNGSGGAMLRGARWDDGANVGLFAVYMSHSASDANPSLGLRCTWQP